MSDQAERAKAYVLVRYPSAGVRPISQISGATWAYVIVRRLYGYPEGWLTNPHRSIDAAWIRAAKNLKRKKK